MSGRQVLMNCQHDSTSRLMSNLLYARHLQYCWDRCYVVSSWPTLIGASPSCRLQGSMEESHPQLLIFSPCWGCTVSRQAWDILKQSSMCCAPYLTRHGVQISTAHATCSQGQQRDEDNPWDHCAKVPGADAYQRLSWRSGAKHVSVPNYTVITGFVSILQLFLSIQCLWAQFFCRCNTCISNYLRWKPERHPRMTLTIGTFLAWPHSLQLHGWVKVYWSPQYH